MLTGLVVVLAVFLVPSGQTWLEQRSEIGRLEAQIQQQEKDLAAARAEEARWNDPAYVRTQARERLQYVLPGETAYRVPGSGQTDLTDPAEVAARSTSSAQAWYANIWTSLRIAGLDDAADAIQRTPEPTPTPTGG